MREETKRLFEDKNFLVLGLAKSGSAVAKLLSRLGARVTVNEQKDRESCSAVEELEAQGVNVICGGHPVELLEQDWFMIIKNPGIPFDLPFLVEAEKRNISIVTEVEIAYLISEAPIIAITGSNGKTTTTTLIFEMLRESHLQPLIAGNIGMVFCEVAEKATRDNWIVAELSSFQLLGTQQFKPEIALVINIFDAHLDYHRTKEHYVEAKKRIFANQSNEQVAILNHDGTMTKDIAKQIASEVHWFSMEPKGNCSGYCGSYINNNKILYRGKDGLNIEVLDVSEVKLIGQHNLENVLAAVSVAFQAGAEPTAIQHVLRTFAGVDHRLQFVSDRNGVHFYNDSKATNGLATMKALQAFSNSVILIAGGLDRGEDFTSLKEVFASKVKGLIAYGQIAEKISHVAKEAGVNQIVYVHNVRDAVSSAANIAQEGDIVLLSPAAASWDQFRSFEERGDMFTQTVHMLR